MQSSAVLLIGTLVWFSLAKSLAASDHDHHDAARSFKVVNKSGERISVEWIDQHNGHRIPLGAPTNGESLNIDSFVNHTFVIRSSGGNNSANKDHDEPKSGSTTTEQFYQVTDDEIQVLVVKDGMVVDKTVVHDQKPTSHSKLEAVDIASQCREQANTALEKNILPQSKILEQLTECLTSRAAQVFVQKADELHLEAALRTEMSRLAENYTCADTSRQVSPPIVVRNWNHNGMDREVHVLHERPGSQIHMLPNFISEEECQAVQEAAAATLHRGTVADGKGGSKMSENRKAWQAGIKVPWDQQGNHIAAVSRRLFAYTNHATGYNLTLPGQEDLMSIQYFGNGLNDPTPDRYMPHCDGQCDGLPFKHGGRVATMVMYCDVPEVGGGTNFQNAGVYVKATKGAAAFFSYLNKDTMRTEEGFTTHSGCPVLEGTKRIAVQWMRIGVDEEHPWTSYDTNNVLYETYQ